MESSNVSQDLVSRESRPIGEGLVMKIRVVLTSVWSVRLKSCLIAVCSVVITTFAKNYLTVNSHNNIDPKLFHTLLDPIVTRKSKPDGAIMIMEVIMVAATVDRGHVKMVFKCLSPFFWLFSWN